MLVLTRKLGEKIVIGNDIIVVVTEIRGSYVKLGVEAPKTIGIYREEVLARIISENKNAAGLHPERLEDILTRGIAQKSRPPE